MTKILPQPIRPRALKRATAFDGYFTSDGRYEFRPARYGTDRRVRFWNVVDTTGQHIPSGDTATNLDDIRRTFCAPGNKVPWLVLDMDDGVVRVEATRAETVKWACRHYDGKVIGRELENDGFYDYTIGYDREDCSSVWIARADVVHRHGFEPTQEPWYPYPDDPHDEGPRALGA